MEEWFSHFLREAQADIYDQLQSLRPDYNRAMTELKAALERHVKSKPDGLKALDIACGTAAATRLLCDNRSIEKKKFKKLVGLDSDSTLLKFARTKCPRLDPFPADMIQAQIRETFDLILCSFAYHHVPDDDKQKLCENMRKWCKRNGDLFVLEICLSGGQIQSYYERVKAELPPQSSISPLCRSFLDWTMAANPSVTGEWKVPLSRLMRDFTNTGWIPKTIVPIWPIAGPLRDAGCFLLHFTPTKKE